jgi:ligand-binding SRPBCC domain-containing protein
VSEYLLEREQDLPVGIEEAFAFFAEAANLEAITPPWLHFAITTPTPIRMGEGTLIRYRLRLHGIPVRWMTEIVSWDPPHGFVDRQIRGPYRLWHHTHAFTALDDGRTRMVDRVRYAQRLGPLGGLAQRLLVARDLDRIFDYRRKRIGELIG